MLTLVYIYHRATMLILIQIISLLFYSAVSISEDSDQFAWSAERKLTWDDFKGKPTKTNPAAALTFTDIHISASYTNGKINVEVKNFFDKKLSWTKNKTSASLLKHEQVHFDITEVHTRIIRKKLSAIASEKSLQNGSFNKESSKLLKEWHEFQEKYDKETDHGLIAVKQKEWEDKVALLLKEE